MRKFKMEIDDFIEIMMIDIESQYGELFKEEWYEYAQYKRGISQVELICDRIENCILTNIRQEVTKERIIQIIEAIREKVKYRYLQESAKHKNLLIYEDSSKQFDNDLILFDNRLTQLKERLAYE